MAAQSSVLASEVTPGSIRRALDVCGHEGEAALELAAAGCSVVTLSPNPTMASRIRGRMREAEHGEGIEVRVGGLDRALAEGEEPYDLLLVDRYSGPLHVEALLARADDLLSYDGQVLVVQAGEGAFVRAAREALQDGQCAVARQKLEVLYHSALARLGLSRSIAPAPLPCDPDGTFAAWGFELESLVEFRYRGLPTRVRLHGVRRPKRADDVSDPWLLLAKGAVLRARRIAGACGADDAHFAAASALALGDPVPAGAQLREPGAHAAADRYGLPVLLAVQEGRPDDVQAAAATSAWSPASIRFATAAAAFRTGAPDRTREIGAAELDQTTPYAGLVALIALAELSAADPAKGTGHGALEKASRVLDAAYPAVVRAGADPEAERTAVGQTRPAGAPGTLRRYPYPYRAMLAICNDIDQMSVRRFREVHRFLNTEAGSLVGAGVGLDIADSFWFYRRASTVSDPLDDLMAYFSGLDWQHRAPVADELIAYCHAGWVDCLHSYGNFSGIRDPDLAFTRAHAQHAIAAMQAEDIQFPVWINHGDAHNVQNLGRFRAYMQGDRPGSPAYHWDLLRETGCRYIWGGGKSFDYGHHQLLSAGTLQDGDRVLEFSRFYNMNVDTAIQNGLSPAVARQSRISGSSRHVVLWHPLHLHVQLGDALLDGLVENGLSVVIAQHLGAAGPGPTLGRPAVAALRALRKRQDDGQILVARTSRLMAYHRARDYLGFDVQDRDGGTVIDIDRIDEPSAGPHVPSLTDVRGITIYCRDPEKTELRLAGHPLPAGEVVRNPSDGHAPSIGIRWYPADRTDYTRDFDSREPGQRSVKGHRMAIDLESLQQRALEFLGTQSDQSPDGIDPNRFQYALKYTSDRFKIGLNRYAQLFDSLGFKNCKRGLDIGSGAGHWAVAFLDRNERVDGIDVRPEFVELANRVVENLDLGDLARFETGKAEELPYEDAAFDAAWSHGVLMFTDHEAALAEVGRVLKPGGYFYCGYSSFGFRANGPLDHISKGNLKAARAQVANLVGDRLFRAGVNRNAWSNTRAYTLDELLDIARLFGLSFVDEPGLQDAAGHILGLQTTVDFLVKRTEHNQAGLERLKTAEMNDDTLAELEHLHASGAPQCVVKFFAAHADGPDSLDARQGNLYLRALIKAGRANEATAKSLLSQEQDPMVQAVAAMQRRAYGEVRKQLADAEAGRPSARFLLGMACLGQDDTAAARQAFEAGLQDPSCEVACQIGLMEIAGRSDLDTLRASYADFLRMLGRRNGAPDDAEALVARLNA